MFAVTQEKCCLAESLFQTGSSCGVVSKGIVVMPWLLFFTDSGMNKGLPWATLLRPHLFLLYLEKNKNQPLTPPEVSPPTRFFSIPTKRITTGTIA